MGCGHVFVRVRLLLYFVVIVALRQQSSAVSGTREHLARLFAPPELHIAAARTRSFGSGGIDARPTVKLTQLARGYGAHSLQQPPITWLLLLAGDVLPNPGPGLRPICPRCHRPVLESVAALQCDGCDSWLHHKCELLSLPAYRRLAASPTKWYCGVCALPPFDDNLFSPPTSQCTRPAPVVSASPMPVSTARGGSSPPVPDPTHALGINNGLTLWYSNCRSIKNKVLDLQATVASLPCSSVILLSETWLDPGVQGQ